MDKGDTSKFINEDNFKDVCKYIDSQSEKYVTRLKEAISIPSISSLSANQNDLNVMLNWTDKALKEHGFTTYIKLPDKYKGDLKYPFLFGFLPSNNKSAQTLMIYCHLDVVNAEKSDGWKQNNPFNLEVTEEFLSARGSTDDKGPLVAWLNAFSAIKDLNMTLPPLNLKIFFETGEEIGSPGLLEILQQEKSFFSDVDYLIVTDNYWVTPDKPCLTYGLRGLVYFVMEIQGVFTQDQHSGIYGGSIDEPMRETLHILDSLVDRDGKILVSGVYDDVPKMTDAERTSYQSIHMPKSDTDNYMFDSQEEIIAARWRYPALSVHGFEGGTTTGDFKAVIPHRILSKFSMRLVPNQRPDDIAAKVKAHIEAKHKEWVANRTHPNTCKVETRGPGVQAWYNEPWDNPLFVVGKKAFKMVYGDKDVDFTREGGSIPAVTHISNVIPSPKNVILIPITNNEGAHSQNERIYKSHFINATKVMLAYLYQASLLQQKNTK